MTEGPSTTEVTTSTSGSESGSATESGSMTTGGVCGDGTVDPQEACDDGNQTPDDGCEPNCTVTPSVCGDGIVEGAEECDDGPDNGAYGSCAVDCGGLGPRCGDGIVDEPEGEDCDDGNQVDEDDCSNECVAPRYAFVTQDIFPGDLNGLAGADLICQASGMQIDAGATWTAWLSDDVQEAVMRLDTSFQGFYRRPDKVVIAKGWSGLTNTPLLNPINVDELGDQVDAPGAAWTSTSPTGFWTGSAHCLKWSTTSQGYTGLAGAVNAVDETWTVSQDVTCNTSLRLYCFQN